MGVFTVPDQIARNSKAGYGHIFDRCVDVMTQLLQKYGHQVLDKLEQDAPQTADCSKDDKQAQPLADKAA